MPLGDWEVILFFLSFRSLEQEEKLLKVPHDINDIRGSVPHGHTRHVCMYILLPSITHKFSETTRCMSLNMQSLP